MKRDTDYGRPERKQPSLHGRKFNHNPKFLVTAEAYFVCHICPIFQISLIYAFIGCPQSVKREVNLSLTMLHFAILVLTQSHTLSVVCKQSGSFYRKAIMLMSDTAFYATHLLKIRSVQKNILFYLIFFHNRNFLCISQSSGD